MPSKKRLINDNIDSGQTVAVSGNSPTFEASLAELEELVHDLERDDLTLDAALGSFERGIKLLRTCDAHLNHARGKITELLKGEDGAFVENLLGTSLESFLNVEKEP